MLDDVIPSAAIGYLLEATDPRFPDLLDRLVEELKAVDGVEVICVAGSVAAGTADLFSDLDLQCVVTTRDATTASAIHDSVSRVIEIGDERWTAPGRILSTVSTTWVRIDVTLVVTGTPLSHTAIEAWPNPGADRSSPGHPLLTPDPAGLTRLLTRFIRSVGLIVRDLHRGDLRLGSFATEFLVDELISLMYLQQGIVRGAQKGTYDQLPTADLDVLQALPVATPDRDSIIAAHIAVADEYLRRSRALTTAWGATWPDAMVDGTRTFLRAHLGATFSDTADLAAAKVEVARAVS